MGAEPQHTTDRREARLAWCAEQRDTPFGPHSAVFYPGDEIRCPARFNHPGRERERGLPCGHSLNLWVKPLTQVVARMRSFRDAPSPTGIDSSCRSCHAKIELFTLAEATG